MRDADSSCSAPPPSPPKGKWRFTLRARKRPWRAFLRERRSAVALEMATVALPFMLMMLGVMETTYDLYVQAALNYILQQTAKQIWSGQIALSASQSSTSFVTTYVCPLSAGLLECGLISMNTQRMVQVAQGTANTTTTADFFHIGQTSYVSGGTLSVSTWTVCSGGPTSVDMLEAVYAGPTFVGALVPSFTIKNASGARIHATYASTGYGVEQFTQATSC